jgi:hypothetical protein
MPDGPSPFPQPDGQASDTRYVNTVRGMSLGAVNPLKATSMVGLAPDSDDEFRVTRTTRGDGGVDLLR